MDVHSPTPHVVWSADMRRKRPVLGGNSGLVSVVQCHRKQTEAVLKCASAACLGQAQQKNTRYKNKPEAAWQGICRNRKYPTEGETAGEREDPWLANVLLFL